MSWHYFKYVIIKYIESISNATTTVINTYIKVIWRWSKGGNSFLFTLVTNKGEHSIFSQRKQILTRVRKRVRYRERGNIVISETPCIRLGKSRPMRFKSYPGVSQILLYSASPGIRPYDVFIPRWPQLINIKYKGIYNGVFFLHLPTILMSMYLQSIVDELISQKQGRKIKRVSQK
jgi:hypothetical protein